MREPTELGSVATDNWGDLWARYHDGRWYDRHGNAKTWGKIDAPTLVHRGYTPPKPEPTNEWATIRTVAGLHWQRRADGCWYSVGLGPVRKAWGLIPGISEGWVLVFAGVPDA
jgi:hypothetical protein